MKMLRNALAGLSLAALAAATPTAQAQVDLAIGNITAGYDSWDNNTKQLRGVYFDMLNNGDTDAGSFTVSIYFVDAAMTQDYLIDSFTRNRLGNNSLVEVRNYNIDLSNIQGIPDGDYRLNVWIDSDQEVSESDEDNNRIFITPQGQNLTYTAGTTAMAEPAFARQMTLGPNPVQAGSAITLSGLGATQADVQLLGIDGRLLLTTTATGSTVINLPEGLTQGLYLVRVSVGGQSVTRKLLVP